MCLCLFSSVGVGSLERIQTLQQRKKRGGVRWERERKRDQGIFGFLPLAHSTSTPSSIIYYGWRETMEVVLPRGKLPQAQLLQLSWSAGSSKIRTLKDSLCLGMSASLSLFCQYFTLSCFLSLWQRLTCAVFLCVWFEDQVYVHLIK